MAAEFLESKSSLVLVQQSGHRWRSYLLQRCYCSVGTLRSQCSGSRTRIRSQFRTLFITSMHPRSPGQGLSGWVLREVKRKEEKRQPACPGGSAAKEVPKLLGAGVSCPLSTDNFLAILLRLYPLVKMYFPRSLFSSSGQSSPVPKAPFQQKMPG